MDALIIAKWFHTTNIEDTGTDLVPPTNANKLYYETEDDEQIADNSNYILKYNGDYINERSPPIINIMITAVFNFGAYTEDFDPIIGNSN